MDDLHIVSPSLFSVVITYYILQNFQRIINNHTLLQTKKAWRRVLQGYYVAENDWMKLGSPFPLLNYWHF